ncbi:hypothetical protein GIB67_013375, partial [Kingdonia uniflora]
YPGKRSDLRYLTRGRSKYSLKRVRPTPRAITTSLSLFAVGAEFPPQTSTACLKLPVLL